MYVAFPRSEYYGYADSLQTHPRFSGVVSNSLFPLSLASSGGSPMFTATDSTESRRWRLPCDPIRSLRNPNRPKGNSGDLWRPLDWYSPVTSLGRPFGRGCCPIGQGIETGGKFPVGQNPLRLDSPYDFSAKPGLLAACLMPHRYLSGACGSRGRASLPRLAPTAHWLPDKARGIFHPFCHCTSWRTHCVSPPPLRTGHATFTAPGSPGTGFPLTRSLAFFHQSSEDHSRHPDFTK
jgi:hypothetical protein